MDGPLAHLDDRALERLAYGRTVDAEGQALALAAGEELARRARALQAAALRPEAPSSDAPLDSPANPEGAIEADRPWWRRLSVPAAAGILVLVVAGGSLLAPTLVPGDAARPPAFAIFDGTRTDAESSLREVLQRSGHIARQGPKVLGEVEYGTVVAWLPRPAGSIRQTLEDGTNTVDGPAQVCVGVIEPNPISTTLVVSAWNCSEVGHFAADGLSITLEGQGGEYNLQWSRVGDVALDADVSAAQQFAMNPGFRRVFIPGAMPPVPYPQDTAALLFDQAGYIGTSIRLIPVFNGLPGGDAEESLIAFTGSVAGTYGQEKACLAIITDAEVRELACTDERTMQETGLVLEFARAEASWSVQWSSEGEVSFLGRQRG